MSLAALIAAQRVQHGVPVAVSCRALGVSQAWFFKWRKGDRSPRRKRRVALAAMIAYLSPGTTDVRITADLRALGRQVSNSTIAKLAGRAGLLPLRRAFEPECASDQPTPDCCWSAVYYNGFHCSCWTCRGWRGVLVPNEYGCQCCRHRTADR